PAGRRCPAPGGAERLNFPVHFRPRLHHGSWPDRGLGYGRSAQDRRGGTTGISWRLRSLKPKEIIALDQLGLLIANEDQQASGGAVFERRNPISGEVATRAASATVEDAQRAADAAAAAFPEWSGTSPKQRRMVLLKAADVLESKAPQFVEAMGAEIGATA